MQLGLAHYAFEAGHFRRENASAQRGQAVIAAPGIVVVRSAGSAFDHPQIRELLKVVVKGAGAQFILAFGLPRDLLHDPVAMPVLGGEGKEDVKGRRG
jgi:hypothetical protein